MKRLRAATKFRELRSRGTNSAGKKPSLMVKKDPNSPKALGDELYQGVNRPWLKREED